MIEVGLLLLVVLVLIAGRYGHYHDRWFGYRSLAEAFRPGNVVALTGVHHRYDDGAEAADRGSLREPWFQRAFSEGWRARPTPAVHDADAIGIRRFLAWWIDDQINYHRTRARRCDRRQRFLTASVYALFGTTITAALLHVFEVGHHSGWTEWFEFLAIALPGFGAAVTGIREQRQFRHHARHSSRTAARLEGLRRRLDPETGLSAVQRLASETHAVIATENVDWSDVMEFQDLELAF